MSSGRESSKFEASFLGLVRMAGYSAGGGSTMVCFSCEIDLARAAEGNVIGLHSMR